MSLATMCEKQRACLGRRLVQGVRARRGRVLLGRGQPDLLEELPDALRRKRASHALDRL
jgi:hypothetical protein